MSSAMRKLTVELGARAYPIFIGTDLIADPALYRPYIGGRRVMIVTNETVGPLYLERVEAALTDYQTGHVVLPDGEQYKTLAVLDQIFTTERGTGNGSALLRHVLSDAEQRGLVAVRVQPE